ncbi:hypothetical protein ACFL35_01020 [Candidatus Riflebacteria bacterium]
MRLDFIDSGILVDFFEEEGDYFFLTHCHSDHLRGLNSDWDKGVIFTSSINCSLLPLITGVDPGRVREIPSPFRLKTRLSNVEIEVEQLDANHCMGAVMYFIKWFSKQDEREKTCLVTGDFRVDDRLLGWAEAHAGVDYLLYDDTYEKENIEFPMKSDSILEVVEIIRQHPNRTIYLAVYNVGKEDIILKIHEILGKKVYFPFRKKSLLEAKGLNHCVTFSKRQSNIRAYHRNYFINHGHSLDKDCVVIFPSGLKLELDLKTDLVYQVFYSEHCDSFELNNFLSRLAPVWKKPLFQPF